MKIASCSMYTGVRLGLCILSLLLIGCTTVNPVGCQDSPLLVTDLTHSTQQQLALLPDGTACTLEVH
jgi:hypothetical protein